MYSKREVYTCTCMTGMRTLLKLVKHRLQKNSNIAKKLPLQLLHAQPSASAKSRAKDCSICQFVVCAILAGREDNGCFASPRATCSSYETCGYTRPTQLKTQEQNTGCNQS